MIFVTVGTHEQPFDRLIECVDNLKRDGVITEDVVLQTGYSTYEPKYCTWQKLYPYQQMIKLVDEARIVITHGGPSSFIMPLQIGKTPIVVPRRHEFNEHVNDHQVYFSKSVAERMGTIIVVEDIDKLGETIKAYDEIINGMGSEMKSNNAYFNAELSKLVDDMFGNKSFDSSKKIRVAFVETNCKKNGPIKQTLNIIQHMDRSLFEPALITVWPEEAGNSMIDDYRVLGIPVFCCNLSKKQSVLHGKKKVTNYLKQFEPDIVQGVGMPPYRMTLGYKKAIHLVTLRNYCYEDYPDYYGKIPGTVMAFLDINLIKKQMKKGEPFVTCSESLTMMYKNRQNMLIPYIRNGVDVGQYTKRETAQIKNIREKLNLPQNKIIFVYSGAFIERKNQREAIEAFLGMKRCKEGALLLLGDGKDFGSLRDEFKKNKNIIFGGKVSNVNEYLHASDVYLSTSKSEGLPNGVLEAMACGLPVILSNIPQHMEVLETETSCGHSYTLGDVEQLSSFMDQMMDENLYEMGARSYKSVMENFTAEGMSKNYQDLYLKIMNKGGIRDETI
ncbi:MAG: glycosyltransferase [Coprococcus sp.]|nr:glycosyltransferase [Coprococcus sp.]